MAFVLSEDEGDAIENSDSSAGPAATRMAIDVQDRIRELKQSLREERRALHEAEERYLVLESKYQELRQQL
jgi:4-hydroxyphenylpyruvate dioxygenase-like putative hemolysin